eukprot:gene699-862_t
MEEKKKKSGLSGSGTLKRKDFEKEWKQIEKEKEKEREKEQKEKDKEREKEKEKEREREKEQKEKEKEKKKELKEKEKEKKDKDKEKDKDKKKDKDKEKDKDDKKGGGLFSKVGEFIESITDSSTTTTTTTTTTPTTPTNNTTNSTSNPATQENHKKAMEFWVNNTQTSPNNNNNNNNTNNNIPITTVTLTSSPNPPASNPLNNSSSSIGSNTSSSPKHNNQNQNSNLSTTASSTLSPTGTSPVMNSGRGNLSKKESASEEISREGDENRKKLVGNLVQFFTSYSESIKVIVDLFLAPLRKGEHILSQEEIKSVFSSIESISSFNQVIIEDLQKHLNSWNSTTHSSLLSTFAQFIGYLKLYKVYGLQYNYSLASLSSLCFDNTRFEAFIKNGEHKLQNDHSFKLPPIVPTSDNGVIKPISLTEILGTQHEITTTATSTGGHTFTVTGLRKTASSNSVAGGSNTAGGKYTQEYTYSNLPSLLLLPIHFLARFHHFFKQMVDSIPILNPDYKSYNQLYKQIGVVIKEIVNESNSINKVLSISNSIKSTTIGLFNKSEIIQSRRFLKEGPLTEQFNNQKTTYYTFLFSDIILFTDKIDDRSTVPGSTSLIPYEGSLYFLKRLEKLSNIQVDDPELGFEFRKGFQIKTKDNQQSIFYMSSSEKEKGSWFQLLSQAIAKATPNNSDRPYLSPSTSQSSTGSTSTSSQDLNEKESEIEEEDSRDTIIGITKAISSGRCPKVELNSQILKLGDPKPLFTVLANSQTATHLVFAPLSMTDKIMPMALSTLAMNRSLTHLCLSNNQINNQWAEALGDMLRFNHSLIQLDLNDNQIGDKGFYSLVDGIISHPSLSIVSFTVNQITDASAKQLSKLLRFNQTLNALFLEENQISNQVAAELLDIWIGNFNTALTLLVFPSTPPDYNEKVKNKIMSIRNRLDKKRKLELNNSLNSSSGSVPRKVDTNVNSSNSSNNSGSKGTLLDLSYCEYAEISVQLLNKLNMLNLDNRRLGDLRELYLDHNCINNLSGNIFKELKTLVLLDLSNNQLSSLPPEISELKELRYFNLAHNNMTLLPNEIGQLTKLVHFDISFNFIESINVDALSQLTSLKVLMMQRNYFSRLPPTLFEKGKLESLEAFSINGSPCFHPTKQRVLEAVALRVTKLCLSDMGITALPLDIGFISGLLELDVSNNRIKDLPPQIGQLTQMVTLDISHNLIEKLPWQLYRCEKLKSLKIVGNPLVFEIKLNLPDEMVDEDLKGLMSYLRTSPGLEKTCMRMKLMLVGQENVGKTSIAKCLKKEVVPVSKKLRQTIGFAKKNKHTSLLDTEIGISGPAGVGINPLNTTLNLSTDGIDMDDWRPPSEDQLPVTFSIWDFAGQEVYYSTHQFFISSRSVFIVVFNMTFYSPDDSRVPYWLQCIEAWGGKSPIILVGTHLDELQPTEIAQITQDIQNKYFSTFPNVKFFLPVSCKSGKNINKLQNLIVKLGKSEKKLGEIYSRAYFQLDSLIISEREMNTPSIITFREFTEMALSCGIPKDQIQHAADFLKELGIIVFFEDNKSGLDQFIFIDPPWLTKLMATIITSKPNFVQSGVVEQSNLHQIWKPPDFPQHLHHVLLAILQKFEIVHPLPDPKAVVKNPPTPTQQPQQTLNTSNGGIVSRTRSNFILPTTSAGSTSNNSPASIINKFGGSGSLSKGSTLTLRKELNNMNNNDKQATPAQPTSPDISLVPKMSPKYLVPVLLSEDRPHTLEKALEEIRNNNKSNPTVLERIYQFEFIPVGLFSKLMIRAMYFTTVKEYWKTGLLVERDNAHCLMEEVHSLNQVNIKCFGKNASNLLRFIVETSEVLLSGWYKLRYQFMVPCNCTNCVTLSNINGHMTINKHHRHSPAINGSGAGNHEVISAASIASALASKEMQGSPQSPAGGEGSPTSPKDLNDSTSSTSTFNPSDLDLDLSEDYEVDISPGGTLKTSKRKKNQNKFLTLYKTKQKNPKDKQHNTINLAAVSNFINQSLATINVNKNLDPRTLFLYEDIERSFLNKKYEMVCKSMNGEEKLVRLDSLVPELMMSDIGPNFTFDFKELEIIEKIGEGGFGIVHKGKLRGQIVAIKQIALQGNSQAAAEDIFREFRREVWLSNTLTHESIVSLKGYCLDPCCIVMEYIPNGNLYQYLRKNQNIPWSLKLKIAINIADAIKHLHGFTPKICHRDLKSPNILMLSDLSDSQPVVCKVSDFGETRAVVTSALGRDKLSNPIWLSPEIMKGEEYTEKADVYSFGIILWEILTGLQPFDEFPVAHSSFMYQLEDEIINGLRPTIPPNTLESYKTLITDCWQNDPLLRPTFDSILQRLISMKSGGSGSTSQPPIGLGSKLAPIRVSSKMNILKSSTESNVASPAVSDKINPSPSSSVIVQSSAQKTPNENNNNHQQPSSNPPRPLPKPTVTTTQHSSFLNLPSQQQQSPSSHHQQPPQRSTITLPVPPTQHNNNSGSNTPPQSTNNPTPTTTNSQTKPPIFKPPAGTSTSSFIPKLAPKLSSSSLTLNQPANNHQKVEKPNLVKDINNLPSSEPSSSTSPAKTPTPNPVNNNNNNGSDSSTQPGSVILKPAPLSSKPLPTRPSQSKININPVLLKNAPAIPTNNTSSNPNQNLNQPAQSQHPTNPPKPLPMVSKKPLPQPQNQK